MALCAGSRLCRPERLTRCEPGCHLWRRTEPEAETRYLIEPQNALLSRRQWGSADTRRRRAPARASRLADVPRLSIRPRAPIPSRPCEADQVPILVPLDHLDPGAGGPPDAIIAAQDRLRHATLTGEDGLVHARDGLKVSPAPGRGRDRSRLCGRGEEAESKGESRRSMRSTSKAHASKPARTGRADRVPRGSRPAAAGLFKIAFGRLGRDHAPPLSSMARAQRSSWLVAQEADRIGYVTVNSSRNVLRSGHSADR